MSDGLRGFIIPDPRITAEAFAAAASTLTQASSYAGSPEPLDDSALVLEASGVQAQDITVRTIRAGMPDSTAAMVWKTNGDWYGWDGAHILADWEVVAAGTPSTVYGAPHAVKLQDGSVVVAYSYQSNSVHTRVRAPDGTWAGSSVNVYTRGSGTYTVGPFPCLCPLSTGRILLFFWIEGSTNYRLRMHYSDDGGLTWTMGQKNCMELLASTYTPYRTRIVEMPQGLLMLAQVRTATHDQLWQYASSDGGASWILVTLLADDRARPDIAVVDGVAWCAWIQRRAGTAPEQLAYVASLASPFDAIELLNGAAVADVSGGPEWSGWDGTYATTPELALWVDEAGELCILGKDHQAGATGELFLYRCQDETWTIQGEGSGPSGGAMVFQGTTASYSLYAVCAVQLGAQALLVHTLVSSAAWADSLCAVYLGGYSTVTMPLLDADADGQDEQVGWQRVWLPITTPENMGWSYSHSGAATRTTNATGDHFTGGTGDTAAFSVTPAGTLAQGLLAELVVTVTAGTAYLMTRPAVATPTSYSPYVKLTPTSIILLDQTSGAILATVATTLGASGVVVRLSAGNDASVPANDGQVSAWYRASGAGDREWVLLGTFATLQAGTSSTNAVIYGFLSSVSTDVTFKRACYTHGQYAGQNLYEGQDNPSDLLGRPFASSPVSVADVMLSVSDGPTVRGERWTLSSGYDWGIEQAHIEVNASPYEGWRSNDDAANVELIWTLADDPALRMGFILALYLGGTNFSAIEIGGRKAGAVWESITTATLAEATGLKWIRKGDTVFPDPTWGGSTASHYWPEHLLEGGYFDLDGTIRKIIGQSEGWWREHGKRPTLLLEGITGSEPGSGTAGRIIPREAVVLVVANTAYDRLKLIVPAQATAEGYFQAGVLVWGHLFAFGQQYGNGRRLISDFRWEMEKSVSGQCTVRALSRVQKSAEISWPEGVDSSEATTDPLTTGAPGCIEVNGKPLATIAGTLLSLAGVLARLEGAVTPVVYLPVIDGDALASGPVVLTHPLQFLYGRVVSESFSTDAALGEEFGDEENGELHRTGGALRIVGEL